MASAMVQVNVRVPPELHAKILFETAALGSVSSVVNEALEDYFAKKGEQWQDNFELGGKGK